MIVKLTRIGVHTTSLIVALIMAVFGVINGLLMIPVSSMFLPERDTAYGLILTLVLPVFYFVAGYIATAISVLIFNFVARALGGVRLELTEDAEPWADQSA